MKTTFINGIFCITFVMFGAVVYAASEPEDEKPRPNTLIDTNIEISKKIDELARDIDLALTGKQTVRTVNHSRVTIRSQANWSENGAFAYKPHIDLRLHLPNLEKKWQLKFSTYDEEQESGVNRNRLKTGPVRENYGGGVGIAQKLGEVNAEFEPRIEYRDRVEVSYILKLKSAASSKDIFMHPEVELFVRSYSGAGEFIAFNNDFPIYKTFTFTLINEEQYVDRENIFSTNNGFSFGYEYNDNMAQTLSLLFESSSRPSYHLDRYTVGAGFTHKVFQNILHYTVVPYLAFPRDLDFKGAPGVNFELKIIF